MSKLDVVDAPQPATANNEVSTLSANRMLEDAHSGNPGNDAKPIKVADATTQVEQEAPGDGAQAAGPGDGQPEVHIDIKFLLAQDPKDLPPCLQKLQGLADHFDKATDKPKAMGEVKDAVADTVKEADANAAKLTQEVETESKTLKPQFDAAKSGLESAQKTLQDALKQVPDADRKHVLAELNLLVDDKTSLAVKKALEQELSGQKDVLPAANAFVAAEKAAEPIMKAANGLNEKMEEATIEPLATRLVQADILQQGGDKAGAKQAQAEAMALQMGMTIQQFHDLQKQKSDATAPKPSDK